MSFTEWWDGLSVANKTFGIVAVAIFVIALLCLIIGLFVSNNKYKKTRKIRNKENEKGKGQEQQKADGKLQEQIERLKEEIKNIKDIKQPEVRPSKDYSNDFADLKVQNAEIKAKYDALSSMIRNQPQNTQISRDPEIQDLKRQLEATNKKLDEQAKSLSDLKTNQQQQPKEQPNQDAQKEKKLDEQAKNSQQPAQQAQPPVYYPLAPQVVNPAMGGGYVYYPPLGHQAQQGTNPGSYYQLPVPINGYQAQQGMNPGSYYQPPVPINGYQVPQVVNPMFAGGYVPQFSPQVVGTVPATIASQPIQPVVAATPTVSGHVGEIVQPVVRKVYVDRPADDSYLDGPYSSVDIAHPEYPRGYLVHGPYRNFIQRDNNSPSYNPDGYYNQNPGINSRFPSPNGNNTQLDEIKAKMNDFQEQNKAMINSFQEENKEMINKIEKNIEENNDKWQQKQEDRLQEQENKFKELMENLEDNQPWNRKKNPFNLPFDKKKKKEYGNPNDNYDDDNLDNWEDKLDELINGGKKKLGQQTKKPQPISANDIESLFNKTGELVDKITNATEEIERKKSAREDLTVDDAKNLLDIEKELEECKQELEEIESQCAKNEDLTPKFYSTEAKDMYESIKDSIEDSLTTLDNTIAEIEEELSQTEKKELDEYRDELGLKKGSLDDDNEENKEYGNYEEKIKAIVKIINDHDKVINEREDLANLSKKCAAKFLEDIRTLSEDIEKNNDLYDDDKDAINKLIRQAIGIAEETFDEENPITRYAMARRAKEILMHQLENEDEIAEAKTKGNQHRWFDKDTGMRALIEEMYENNIVAAQELERKWKEVLKELKVSPDLDTTNNNPKRNDRTKQNRRSGDRNRDRAGDGDRSEQSSDDEQEQDQNQQELQKNIDEAKDLLKEADLLIKDNTYYLLPKTYTKIMEDLDKAVDKITDPKLMLSSGKLSVINQVAKDKKEKQKVLTNKFLDEYIERNKGKELAKRLEQADKIMNKLESQAININNKPAKTKEQFIQQSQQLLNQLDNIRMEINKIPETQLLMRNAMILANLKKKDQVKQLLGGAMQKEMANARALMGGNPTPDKLESQIDSLKTIIDKKPEDLLGEDGKQVSDALNYYLNALEGRLMQTRIQETINMKGKIVPTTDSNPFTTFCENYHGAMTSIKLELKKKPINASRILNDTLSIFATCWVYRNIIEPKNEEKKTVDIVNEMLKDAICILVYGCERKLLEEQDKNNINDVFKTIEDKWQKQPDEKNTKYIIGLINEARNTHNKNATKMKLPFNEITNTNNIQSLMDKIVHSRLFEEQNFEVGSYRKDCLFFAEKNRSLQSGNRLPALKIINKDDIENIPPVYLCYQKPDNENPQGKMWLAVSNQVYEVTELSFDPHGNNGWLHVKHIGKGKKEDSLDMKIDNSKLSLNSQIFSCLKQIPAPKVINAKPNGSIKISPINFYNYVIQPLTPSRQLDEQVYEMERGNGDVIKFSPTSISAEGQSSSFELNLQDNLFNNKQIEEILYLPDRSSLAIMTTVQTEQGTGMIRTIIHVSNNKLKKLDQNKVTDLSDLETLKKILKTLPMMKKYAPRKTIGSKKGTGDAEANNAKNNFIAKVEQCETEGKSIVFDYTPNIDSDVRFTRCIMFETKEKDKKILLGYDNSANKWVIVPNFMGNEKLTEGFNILPLDELHYDPEDFSLTFNYNSKEGKPETININIKPSSAVLLTQAFGAQLSQKSNLIDGKDNIFLNNPGNKVPADLCTEISVEQKNGQKIIRIDFRGYNGSRETILLKKDGDKIFASEGNNNVWHEVEFEYGEEKTSKIIIVDVDETNDGKNMSKIILISEQLKNILYDITSKGTDTCIANNKFDNLIDALENKQFTKQQQEEIDAVNNNEQKLKDSETIYNLFMKSLQDVMNDNDLLNWFDVESYMNGLVRITIKNAKVLPDGKFHNISLTFNQADKTNKKFNLSIPDRAINQDHEKISINKNSRNWHLIEVPSVIPPRVGEILAGHSKDLNVEAKRDNGERIGISIEGLKTLAAKLTQQKQQRDKKISGVATTINNITNAYGIDVVSMHLKYKTNEGIKTNQWTGLKVNANTIAIPFIQDDAICLLDTSKNTLTYAKKVPYGNIDNTLKNVIPSWIEDYSVANVAAVVDSVLAQNGKKPVSVVTDKDTLYWGNRDAVKKAFAKYQQKLNNNPNNRTFNYMYQCGGVVRIAKDNRNCYGLQINDNTVAIPIGGNKIATYDTNGRFIETVNTIPASQINQDFYTAAGIKGDWRNIDIATIINVIGEIYGNNPKIDVDHAGCYVVVDDLMKRLKNYMNNQNNNMGNNQQYYTNVSDNYGGVQVIQINHQEFKGKGLLVNNNTIVAPCSNGRLTIITMSDNNVKNYDQNSKINVNMIPQQFRNITKNLQPLNAGDIAGIMNAILRYENKQQLDIIGIDCNPWNIPDSTLQSIKTDTNNINNVNNNNPLQYKPVSQRHFGAQVATCIINGEQYHCLSLTNSNDAILVPFRDRHVKIYSLTSGKFVEQIPVNKQWENKYLPKEFLDGFNQFLTKANGFGANECYEIMKAITTFEKKHDLGWGDADPELIEILENHAKIPPSTKQINNKPKHKIEHWFNLGGVVQFQKLCNHDAKNSNMICLLLNDGRLATIKEQQNDNKIYIFNPTTDNWDDPVSPLPLKLVSPYIQKVLNWISPLSSQDLADLIQATVANGGIEWANKERAEAIYNLFQQFYANNMNNLSDINNDQINPNNNGLNLNNKSGPGQSK